MCFLKRDSFLRKIQDSRSFPSQFEQTVPCNVWILPWLLKWRSSMERVATRLQKLEACDIVAYSKKYIFGLQVFPGTQLLKPLGISRVFCLLMWWLVAEVTRQLQNADWSLEDHGMMRRQGPSALPLNLWGSEKDWKLNWSPVANDAINYICIIKPP